MKEGIAVKISKRTYAFFTIPLVFIFLIVDVIPFITGIGYSFFKWDGIRSNPKIFVGLENYKMLFSDDRFIQSGITTATFTLIAVIFVNVVALLFALLVTSKLKSSNAARTMFFMPNLIGGLILGYIWKFIFTDGFKILGELTGFENIFFNWLMKPNFALLALAIVFSWNMIGYMMIIYIVGIQGIPNDVMEAAEIDGASYWEKLKSIKLPLLMPSFTICLFLTLSSSFKIYDINLSLTDGGPINTTELLAMQIYNEIFSYGNYGLGQAKAVVFFVVVAGITLTQVYFTKKREVEM